MKVAVYTISLNEEQFVERFVQSCTGADLILVADTGSTDGTVERLRALGALVYPVRVTPWRFDVARNTALSLIPDDIDVCISLDMDEVLAPGWREALERDWVPGSTTRVRYTYNWSHKPDGSPAVQFLTDKIHARRGYIWKHPCHETLYPDRIAENFAVIPDLVIDHWPDKTKPRSQYLPLLAVAVSEDPTHSRMAFYYARELYFNSQYDPAITEFGRYLRLRTSTWGAERCAALRYIGKCHTALGQKEEALRAFRAATKESPDLREPWVDLAEACYFFELWPECLDAARAALAIPSQDITYINDPRCYGALPHDLASIALARLGLTREALDQARMAAALSDEPRIHSNVTLLERMIGG